MFHLLTIVLSSSAAAAELHTCAATANGPDGSTFTVSGYGADEADARRAARQSARLLADQRLLLEVGTAWLGGGGPERLSSWILAKTDPDFAVPGWTLQAGACSSSTLAGDGGWAARWTQANENVVRATPADALEGARRRACLTNYQVQYLQTLKARVGGGAPEALSSWDGAWMQLVQCWEQAPPTPVPAELLDTPGPTRCVAIGPTGASRAVGYGTSAERAAEDALRQLVIAQSRAVAGEVGSVVANPDPTDREAKIGERMARLAALTGPSDAVDRARLACSSITAGPVVWKGAGRLEKDCNPASWTERPKTVVEASGAGAFLDGTCALQVSSTMQIVGFSLRGAEGPKRDELVASALRTAGSCESNCYADAVWGTLPRPVQLAGAPDRSDKKKVVASLEAAMKGDALKGLQLLPTLQDPAALGRLFDGSLWGALGPQLKTLAVTTEKWKQVEGHWIVLP
jgi:hypothetical protein